MPPKNGHSAGSPDIPAFNENLPPIKRHEPHQSRASFWAYVWRGDKFDQIGKAETTETGHRLALDLGVSQADIIELRGVDETFYVGVPAGKGAEPKPSFTVFFAGTRERAGTAWPHPDGKGHRLKLRHALPDGSQIELQDTGNFLPFGERRVLAKRRQHRPRLEA